MRVVHGARGFCNVNIEAIMIEYLRQAYQIERVAIVDTDCHHGDGTQDIYWHDPDTLFISLHQDGRTLYPGSGFLREMGGPNAVGTTINLPLPPHTSEEGFLHTIEKVVLPILTDFQPDIIVNSAGQDNHYSDPITNMNFSAQGYAKLTSLLKPDIAVLEGGYAIEGALPYVNTGIVLALAGIDTSHIKEPGYDPEDIRQTPEITSWIHRVGEEALEIWEHRNKLKANLQANKNFHTRTRNIFYDTDNIRETQNEILRICSLCAGVLKIDSSASNGHHILAIHIPRNACPDCKKIGHEWYESDQDSGISNIYLQDRTEDIYLGRKISQQG
jgi:hypothetical protein